MLALIKKELKSLFFSPAFLAVISVVSAIPVITLAVFLKLSQAQSEQYQRIYAGFENIISLMVLVFALVIPAVAIASVCREKKEGTDELIYSMPLIDGALVFSKLIGISLFFAIPSGLMAFFPILLRNFGEVNLLHAYSALALLVVFEIFIASLSVMIAEKAERLVISLVISYSVIAISFILGVLSSVVRLLPFGTGFDKVFGGILFELSIFKKADTAIYELLDWSAFVFFILGIVVFTIIAVTNTKRKIATTLVSIALVACVGVLPLLLPYSIRQIDINEQKLYTPGQSTVNYLSSVNEEITVYLINPYTSDSELYNVILRTVESSKSVKLKIVNSDEDKDILAKYGLQNEAFDTLKYSLIVQGSKRWIFMNAQDYSSYYNNDMGHLTVDQYLYRKDYCYNLLSSLYSSYESLNEEAKSAFQNLLAVYDSLENETLLCLQFENALVDAIAYVTADMIPTVYFLTGHGEEGTATNPYDFAANKTFPENADVLVINSPSEDYTEAEVDMLISYVDNGGKIYILTDVENYTMPNLMRFLAYYGLSVNSGVISVDDKTAIPVSINKEHSAFKEMDTKQVMIVDASEIAYTEGTKYTYSSMLDYEQKEGEGAEETTIKRSVAMSVSEGEQVKITLFTGAKTFNGESTELSEDELELIAPCITNVMYWMFDEFESGVAHNIPKISEKFPFNADDGQITKIVVVYFAIILVFVISMSAYMLSRRLRSKRALASQ